MTPVPVQLSLCFSLIFVVSLIRYVVSHVDDREFETNGLGRFNVPYDLFRERLANFDDDFLSPVENTQWRGPGNVGQVSGVSVDPSGRPVIFHRASHTWDYDTFDGSNNYRKVHLGPILQNTVLTLSPVTGEVLYGFGNQTFYLPHGIHVDRFGNVWLTDIAMHQVFKYSPSGSLRLVLGYRFQRGSDLKHFCQPTSVATASTGEIVVADGYCNSRLIVFDPTGRPKYSIAEPWIHFNIPHSITVLPNEDVCVADRENERIVCMNIGLQGANRKLGTPYSVGPRQLGRVFAITSYGDVIYGVNGITSRKLYPRGFTATLLSRSAVNFWGPESDNFVQPHAIAICPNGTAVYISEIGPNRVWKFDLRRRSMKT